MMVPLKGWWNERRDEFRCFRDARGVRQFHDKCIGSFLSAERQPGVCDRPQQPVSQAPGSVPQPINQSAPPDSDPVTAMVSQMTAALSYKANIAVFKTARQMEKTLLDTVA